MLVRKAIFIKSASKLEECPQSDFPEFAMIGRSNVGKSSLINMLVNMNSLVKVSNKPGKTQLINFFLINDERSLVDLPGYGYAKSWRGDRWYWIDATQQFFAERSQLKRVFVLVDWSISPQKIDLEFIATLQEEEIPYTLVMTKIDKVKPKELAVNLHSLKAKVEEITGYPPRVFPISNVSKKWREELLNYIQDLMG